MIEASIFPLGLSLTDTVPASFLSLKALDCFYLPENSGNTAQNLCSLVVQL